MRLDVPTVYDLINGVWRDPNINYSPGEMPVILLGSTFAVFR